CWRSGDATAAKLGEDVHVAFGFLESFRSFGRIVDNPVGETNGAFDLDAAIVEAFLEVAEFAACFHVSSECANPRFDSRVAGVGSYVDFRFDADIFLANGARVEAVAERWHSF
ncbi:MAG: hypothetical protein ACI92G_004174, partial [Candidatus Pelagisphaera sp.]